MLLTNEIVVMEENSRIIHSLISRKSPDFILLATALHNLFFEVESLLSSTFIKSLFLRAREYTSSKLLVLMRVSRVST